MAKGRVAIPIGEVGRNVAANIRRLRAAQGITTRDMATRVGMSSNSNISRIEQGERRIDVDDLFLFAAALGVAPGDLLTSPFACPSCKGESHPGFRCRICGGDVADV